VSEAPTPGLFGLSRHAHAVIIPFRGPCLAHKQPFQVSERRAPPSYETKASGGLTTRWSRPGQPAVTFSAILPLAGRAAHLEAVGRRGSVPPEIARQGIDMRYARVS